MYLLTEYMEYGHWVVVVLASYMWDRWWLKVGRMVCVSCFQDFIHNPIFQTEQHISKLDFLFCGEKVGRCTQVRPLCRIFISSDNCHLSHITTTGPCVCVASQVGSAYIMNEPRGSYPVLDDRQSRMLVILSYCFQVKFCLCINGSRGSALLLLNLDVG